MAECEKPLAPHPFGSFTLGRIARVDYTEPTQLKPSQDVLTPAPEPPLPAVGEGRKEMDAEAAEIVEKWKQRELAQAPASPPTEPPPLSEPTELPVPKEKKEKTQNLPTAPDYVSAEANLEVIGYFDASYKRRYPKKPNEAKVVTLGDGRTFRFVPSSYGYPNTEDLDFYRGFQKICEKRVTLVEKWENGKRILHPHLKLPIAFSTREFLLSSGRKESGRDWKAAREWIKRNKATTVEGELYLAKEKRPKAVFGTSLFRLYYLAGDKTPNGKVADMNYVWPEEWFLSNFYYHYFKPKIPLSIVALVRTLSQKTSTLFLTKGGMLPKANLSQNDTALLPNS